MPRPARTQRAMVGPSGRTIWTGLVLLACAGGAPFLLSLDATVAAVLDGWRRCGVEPVFAWMSDTARPLGVAVLVLAVGRRLAAGPAPRLRHAALILVALGAGSLLIEALKMAIDRPRPGAEFLTQVGNSFPSGHVGNTLLVGFAVLALLADRPGARPSAVGLLGLAGLAVAMGAARLYEGRHWASDVLGTAFLFGGYGALAFVHPDTRWRAGAVAGALLVSAALFVAAAGGWRPRLQIAAPASAAPPVERLAFGSAFAEKRLRGGWAPDGPDPFRSSAWMTTPDGQLVLDGITTPAGEVRIVGRPHPGGRSAACRRLRVELNGVPLGERLLQVGWRAYVFSTAGVPFRPDENVVTLAVRNERPDGRRPGRPLAAFSELTLHARRP